MSDRIMNVTAAAAWLLAFCVMAFAVIFVMISKVSADVYADCPDVFTTQDICYIPGAMESDVTLPANRILGMNEVTIKVMAEFGGKQVEANLDVLAVYPKDGCDSHDGWSWDDDPNSPTYFTPKHCFAPLRFAVGNDSYCIQDNTAHGWQLCSTDDTMTMPAPMPQETETNTQPANPPVSSEWTTNCGHRTPGVYGTTANQLLCWGDQVGGDLGGDDDPYGYYKWTTFTDCTPEGCRTYTN